MTTNTTDYGTLPIIDYLNPYDSAILEYDNKYKVYICLNNGNYCAMNKSH